MKRISTATRVVDKFGAGKDGYTDGDVIGGIPATDLEAALFDNLQEEIANVIEGAGITLNGAVLTQLRQAVKRLFGGNVTTVNAANTPVVLTADNAGLVLMDATAGNIAATLPAANVLAAMHFKFVRVDAAANTATVTRAGADTIDGVNSFTLAGGADYRAIAATGAALWVTTAAPAVTVPMRQTILSGATAFLAIGAGLNVTLLGLATPLRLSIPAGMGDRGAIDYAPSIVADLAGFFVGITASVINYLFVDRNPATGALSGAAKLLPYIAQKSGVAVSTVSGQRTYVYDIGVWYEGTGAGTTVIQTVAVGECLAGAATITSVTPYAIMGDAVATDASCIGGVRISKNHNIGTKLIEVEWFIVPTVVNQGYEVGEDIDGKTVSDGSLRSIVTNSHDRLAAGIICNTGSIWVMHKTTGTASAFTTANATTRMHARRAFN